MRIKYILTGLGIAAGSVLNSSFAQEVKAEANQIHNLAAIKQKIEVPKDHKCDTSIILEYKKTYAKCLYQGNETMNVTHLGREYIEGEGPKILFRADRYYLEGGEPKYIHEKEYYHYVDKYTKVKEIRSWEAYYVVENGKSILVEEVKKGKERRANFNEQSILEFYYKANDILNAASAQK